MANKHLTEKDMEEILDSILNANKQQTFNNQWIDDRLCNWSIEDKSEKRDFTADDQGYFNFDRGEEKQSDDVIKPNEVTCGKPLTTNIKEWSTDLSVIDTVSSQPTTTINSDQSYKVRFFADQEEVITIDLQKMTVDIAEGFSVNKAAHIFWQRVTELAEMYMPRYPDNSTQPVDDGVDQKEDEKVRVDDETISVRWSQESQDEKEPYADAVGEVSKLHYNTDSPVGLAVYDIDKVVPLDLTISEETIDNIDRTFSWSELNIKWEEEDDSEEAYKRAMKVVE